MQSAALAICLLLQTPPATAAMQDTCANEAGEHCAADETPLIQLPAHSSKTHDKIWCFGYPQKTQTQCGPIEAKLGEDQTVGWWDLPEQDLGDVPDKVTPFTDFEPPDDPVVKDFLDSTTWGVAKAELAVNLLFERTKVEPIFDEVPELLRGVFWMKNNGIPEELTVFQYGRWFKEEGIYVATVAPFSWAWPAGKPKDAPYGGGLYSDDASRGAQTAVFFSVESYAISYKFGRCPWYAKCHGHDKLGNMSFAYMQFHEKGQVKSFFDVGDLFPLEGLAHGVFTLENSESAPGTHWQREIRWGAFGRCSPLQFGSYDLVRVMDGMGKPVKPNYEEFVAYMGDVELLMWTGFQNETAREHLVDANRRSAAM